VLVAFLSDHDSDHCKDAHPLAEKVRDPAKRAALVKTFRKIEP
jgi:hypothetical protein